VKRIDDVTREVPGQIRAAAVLVGLEALALLVAAVVLLVKTVTQSAEDTTAALLEAALALLGAVVLYFGARGLLALKQSARTPIIVLQLLALPVAYSLGFQAGLMIYGGPILIAALATLYLLFTPPARAALEHRDEEDS
jgi:hypothetical protein